MSAFVLILLAGCGEQVPETTLDGIFTASQAQRGDALFATHCARCHSIQEFSGRAFNTIWAGVPLSALYLRIANTMPLDQPGSLGNAEATALTAHILSKNGMPASESPLQVDLQWMNGILIALPDSATP